MRSIQGLPSPKKLPSSPKKQATRTKTILPESYLEILGSNEPLAQSSEEVGEEADEVAQLILDKQKTLARAMKAATDGVRIHLGRGVS